MNRFPIAAGALTFLALLALSVPVPAQDGAGAAPARGYVLQNDRDYRCLSPDGRFRVEQYRKDAPDGATSSWLFEVLDSRNHCRTLVDAAPTEYYGAAFRFSPDSGWLVRMQKTGAGCSTLFLYKRDGSRFVEATRQPLGELAWQYYASVRARLRLPEPVSYHVSADLIQGYETGYRRLGYDWPPGRCLVIGLDTDSFAHPFWCIYDTATGNFSLADSPAARRAAMAD